MVIFARSLKKREGGDPNRKGVRPRSCGSEDSSREKVSMGWNSNEGD